MAAFGLYTHIKSNRRRSAFLLAALFTLVYVLTFAGALVRRRSRTTRTCAATCSARWPTR